VGTKKKKPYKLAGILAIWDKKITFYIIYVFHNSQLAVFSGYFEFLDIDILDPFMSVSLGFVFQYLTLYYFFVLFWWPTLIEG